MNDKNHVDDNSVPKKIRIKKNHSTHQQLPPKLGNTAIESTKLASQVIKPVEKECTQVEIAINQC